MPETKNSTAVYNKALTDAIQAIYRVYGSDLGAFFRDVKDPAYASRERELQNRLTEVKSSKRKSGPTAR